MKNWLLKTTLVTALCSLAIVSCSKKDKTDSNSGPELDRKPMLVNYASNYIQPGYTAMLGKLSVLKAKTESFTATPGEAALNALRTAWREAYITWQKVDMLEFGPAEDVSLRMYMNTYPVTVAKVNTNISTGNYDLEQFGNKDAQGFAAIDYLVNGIGTTSQDILLFYTTDADATARKKYLLAIVDKMFTKVESVKNKWETYSNDFANNTGTDVNGSLSRMVNSFVLYYERYLRSGKIGLPAGAMTGTPVPGIVEAYYSPELSKELALTALTSVKDFYEGKSFDGNIQDASMKTYLSAIGTTDDNGKLIADVISGEMQQAIASLEGLNTNLEDAVQNDRSHVLSIYDELQELIPLLKVDMVSAFGISITYTDNDGD